MGGRWGSNIIDFARERRRRGPRFDGGVMKILEVSRDLVCLCRAGEITAINGAGTRLLGGKSPDEIIRRGLADFLIPEYGQVLALFLSGMASEDKPIPTRIIALDHSVKDVELQVYRAREIAADATIVVGRDTSHEGKLAGRAQEHGARFTMLVDNAMNMVCHVRDGSIHYINRAGVALLGLGAADDLVGQPLQSFVHPDYLELVAPENIAEVAAEGVIPMRLVRPDGETLDAQVMITPLPSRRGTELMVEVRDISAHNRAVKALRRSAETLEMRVIQRTRELAEQRALAEERKATADAARRFTERLLDLLPNPVWYKDARGRFETTNHTFRELFGPDAVMPAEDGTTDRTLLAGTIDRTVFEATIIGQGGERHEVLVGKTAYPDEEGRAIGVIGVITDITEHKAMERELRRLATTDPLTGAFNRRHFMTTASQEVERSIRHGHALSVLMLDIDHFKRINDAHGHAVGDEALKAVVFICQGLLRDHDVLGRLGGEEFAVLLPETALGGALDAGERLRTAIADITLPLADGQILRMTTSVGVACRAIDDPGFETVLARADSALYRAKAAGRNRVEPE